MADIAISMGVPDANSLGILSPAFKVVQRMADTYRQIKLGQKRCKLIIQGAALIIKKVHAHLQKGPSQALMSDITKFQKKLEEIQMIFQKFADMSLLKALLRFEDINRGIERANGHLIACLQLFPMISLASHVQAQSRAVKSDVDALQSLLIALAGNYEEIRRRFGLYSDEEEDQAMAVMERELRNARTVSREDVAVEVQIIQKSLECIKTTTGRSAPKQKKWLITKYDLEDCGIIGGGGFATVSKAKYRYMMVAVKTFKDAGNMREALEQEVEIWSKLHHDHIVPFYGASTMTSSPFIVSRYMRNGNLVQYLIATPNADRTKLVFEVSLGMYYLHEESVVHGDLKGVNVLVDDSGKACITDFGLSKICSSEAAGTQTGKIAGTLPFLAPEAMRDQALTFKTDIYAFGMLIYEIFTGDVPFSGEPDHLIREGRLKLQRPTSIKVSERGFNDAFWQLLSDCISCEPSARPRFKTILVDLDSLKKEEPSDRSVHSDSAPGVGRNDTIWELDTETMTHHPSATVIDSTEPLLKQAKPVLTEQASIFPTRAPTCNTEAFPSLFALRIEVTHKYFDAEFGISGRVPGANLQVTSGLPWQPIRALKKSLLYQDGNKFWYRDNIGGVKNSWELSGTVVTFHTSVDSGACCFRTAQTAEKWFSLQLSYARDGSVGDWWTKNLAKGDWFYTEWSWRRLMRSRLQRAGGASSEEPTDGSWEDIELPKRCIMGNAETENSIVCITDPEKRPGRLCCKLEGPKIVFETYRHPGDKGPISAREETYPSDESAGKVFGVLRVMFELKTTEKRKSRFPF